jgi:carboxyl-terminal processing protease
MNARTFFLLVSPLLLAGILIGIALRPSLGGGLFWDDRVRDEVQELIDERYVEPLDAAAEQELFDAAMRAYVGTLDPFSRYFTADERRELDEDTTGSFAGVGVQVRAVVAGLLVSAVYRDGPADRAGLRPGDIVTAVDGVDVAGMPLEETIVLIKGEEGTEVTLDVVRDEQSPAPHVVRRGIVGLDTVPSVRLLAGEPAVAYVRVAQFSESTPEEVRQGLERLTAEGAGAIVLDLRQNLGGVVSAAVELAELFLPPRSLVCVTRERHRLRTYTADGEVATSSPAADGGTSPVAETTGPSPAPFQQPLVVLVDEGSASASEILAGALQDHGRAVLVGDRTYGKFVVQTLLTLRASEALIRITTARYETPRGRSGQRHPDGARGGIMPDVRVELSADQRQAVFRAFVEQAGPRWELMEGRELEADESDAQLRAGVELLRGGAPPAEPLRPAPSERG